MSRPTFYYTLTAILLHVVLLFLFSLILLPKQILPLAIYKTTPASIISVMANAPAENTSKPIKFKLDKKNISIHPAQSLKPINQSLTKSIHSSASPIKNATRKHDVLLTMLHSAISAKQQYPDQAVIANEHGKVTLSFTLFPNGTLKNVQIAQSSGYDDLDQAALTALDAIVPFTNAAPYLTAPQAFSIQIIFE